MFEKNLSLVNNNIIFLKYIADKIKKIKTTGCFINSLDPALLILVL